MLLLGLMLGFTLSALVVIVPMVMAQSAPGAPPLQELIPLPGPGQQQPGQAPQTEPGQGDCPILFYFNGQLYQLGPGPQDGPGRPTSPPEFFYLNPYQGPPIPGLPQPFQGPPGPGGPGPNFMPVPPRS